MWFCILAASTTDPAQDLFLKQTSIWMEDSAGRSYHSIPANSCNVNIPEHLPAGKQWFLTGGFLVPVGTTPTRFYIDGQNVSGSINVTSVEHFTKPYSPVTPVCPHGTLPTSAS